MTTATKEVTMTLRLTAEEAAQLTALAELRQSKPASIGSRFVSEGVRRARFPAIDFRDGEPGRVAYLAGSRLPVWLIVSLLRECSGDLDRAARHLGRPKPLLQAALQYAAAYPAEIEAALALHEGRTFKALKQMLPGLERL
jgi:hypothetical protein